MSSDAAAVATHSKSVNAAMDDGIVPLSPLDDKPKELRHRLEVTSHEL
jgi:hypothetical protein